MKYGLAKWASRVLVISETRKEESKKEEEEEEEEEEEQCCQTGMFCSQSPPPPQHTNLAHLNFFSHVFFWTLLAAYHIFSEKAYGICFATKLAIWLLAQSSGHCPQDQKI